MVTRRGAEGVPRPSCHAVTVLCVIQHASVCWVGRDINVALRVVPKLYRDIHVALYDPFPDSGHILQDDSNATAVPAPPRRGSPESSGHRHLFRRNRVGWRRLNLAKATSLRKVLRFEGFLNSCGLVFSTVNRRGAEGVPRPSYHAVTVLCVIQHAPVCWLGRDINVAVRIARPVCTATFMSRGTILFLIQDTFCRMAVTIQLCLARPAGEDPNLPDSATCLAETALGGGGRRSGGAVGG